MSMPINNSLPDQDQWQKLHDNVAESISARLPVADFFRSQFVCRRWKSIICLPNFQKNLKKLFDRQPWFFMVSSYLPSGVVYDVEVNDWHHIRLPIQIPRLPSHPLAASAGLMCCLSPFGALSVCNPLTGSARELDLGAWLADVKAVSMHSWGSYYNVYVVFWKAACLHMGIFSSESNSWMEFPMGMFRLYNAEDDIYVPLGVEDLQMFSSVTETNFYRRKELAGVTAFNGDGDLVVYYLEAWGCLVSCNTIKKTAVICSGFLHGASGLAECDDRVFVATLEEDDNDGNVRLQVWWYVLGIRLLVNIATMPREMSKSYSGVDADISCSGCGDYIMVCASAVDYDFTRVVLCDVMEDTWEEFPPSLGPRCGLQKRFTSGFGFMPSISIEDTAQGKKVWYVLSFS